MYAVQAQNGRLVRMVQCPFCANKQTIPVENVLFCCFTADNGIVTINGDGVVDVY
jgi:hypothetical protein